MYAGALPRGGGALLGGLAGPNLAVSPSPACWSVGCERTTSPETPADDSGTAPCRWLAGFAALQNPPPAAAASSLNTIRSFARSQTVYGRGQHSEGSAPCCSEEGSGASGAMCVRWCDPASLTGFWFTKNKPKQRLCLEYWPPANALASLNTRRRPEKRHCGPPLITRRRLPHRPPFPAEPSPSMVPVPLHQASGMHALPLCLGVQRLLRAARAVGHGRLLNPQSPPHRRQRASSSGSGPQLRFPAPRCYLMNTCAVMRRPGPSQYQCPPRETQDAG